MSHRVPSHHFHGHHDRDRRNAIAMEDFCKLMESPSPIFIQQQPHLSYCNSFSGEPQPQLLFSDSFGSLDPYRPVPQPQLSFSDDFGSRYQLHQQSHFPLNEIFGHSQRLPDALYSKVQVPEYNVLTEPGRHVVREESVDKEAGDFIRKSHNKFNLSK